MITLIEIKPPFKENVRVAADDFFGVKIQRLASGKPVVEGREISISHTGQWLAIMVSDRPCGVDIEFADRAAAHLASRFCDAAQITICSKVLPANPSLLIWCAKEALFKLLGDTKCRIESATADRLIATTERRKVELEWHVNKDNLLIVNTL